MVDRGPDREKIVRMVGEPKSKPWRPKASRSDANGSLDLLGNRATVVEIPRPLCRRQTLTEEQRNKVVGRLVKSEESSKSKMYVDYWDAKLDKGRKKKVKYEDQ